MDAQRITMNFILSPTNIAGIMSGSIETKGVDPIPVMLYAFFNTVLVCALIFLTMERFYERRVALMCIGVYLVVTILLGFIMGIVDQVFNL